MSVDISRRRLLQTIGLTGVTGFAGCGSQSTSSGPPSEEVTKSSGSTRTANISTQSKGPIITSFNAVTSRQAGVIRLRLNAESDNELDTVTIRTPADNLSRSVSGNSVQIDEIIRGAQFQQNDVTTAVRDITGKTSTRTRKVYARKYDVLDDVRFVISVVYLPHHGAQLQQCFSGEDTRYAVGAYGDPVHPSIVDQHIDQMQGHGINALRPEYSFDGDVHPREQMRELIKSNLISTMKVAPRYEIVGVMIQQMDHRYPDRLEESFEVLHNTVFNLPQIETINGRPIVDFWGISWITGPKETSEIVRDYIRDNWEDYGGFVDYLRSGLSIDDTPAYLVANIPKFGVYGFGDELTALLTEFDAVTNTPIVPINPQENPTPSWEDVFAQWIANMEGIYEFANNHGLDYIPAASPGFDERGKRPDPPEGCPPVKRRRVPRSPNHLRQLLAVSQEVRSSSHIQIATWNNFLEGTAIEPGTFWGTNYGTAYLDVVADFQG